MDATKGNGHNAGNAAPAKTLTKYATNFIATIAHYASIDSGFGWLFAVLGLQFALIVWGVLK